MNDETKWFQLDEALSYNAKFIIIMGRRRRGKTWASFRYIFNRYYEKGEKFSYLRRHKNETNILQKSALNVFASQRQIRFNYDFKKYQITVNNEEVGSIDYINNGARGLELHCENILFEECIPANKWSFTDEFSLFTNSCESIGRDSLKRVLITGNNMWLYNPYLLNFNVFNDKDTNTFEFMGKQERAVCANLYSREPYSYIKRIPSKTLPPVCSVYLRGSVLNIYAIRGGYYVECGSPSKLTIGFKTEYNGNELNPEKPPSNFLQIKSFMEFKGIRGTVFADFKAASLYGYLAHGMFGLRLKYIDEDTSDLDLI